ncbi:MAG: NAD(P)H-dependent oxidoreductase [Campylobacterota bacterium]|nr:NAD(P)H-dependent oxidoreductase [Campylobacterota bacterium]
MNREELTGSLYFRHACKLFDEERKIPSEDLHFILDAGRLSPSSFGMEPWHFIVVQNQGLKEKIRPACWNQPQITTCSDLLIITAKVDTPARKEYYEKMFTRREMPQDMLEKYLSVYQQFIDGLHSVYGWSARQCYIAAANIMSYAAMIGVDSCPIEGFEKDKLEEVLELNTTKEQVALVVALGYRVNEQSEKIRLSFDEVVTFR